MKDVEKLEAIVFERTEKLLHYKVFIREKGMETEFKQRIEQAKVLVDVTNCKNGVRKSEYYKRYIKGAKRSLIFSNDTP